MNWPEPINDRAARRFVADMRHHSDAARGEIAGQASDLARHAREAVEPGLRRVGAFARREGPAVAHAALATAGRMASAARRDPVPVMVGAIGLVLVASLVFGRRRT